MWNYGLSWINSFPIVCAKHASSFICKLDTTPTDSGKDKTLPREIDYKDTDLRKLLEKKLLEEWVDSMFITNEIIGIKFSVAEAAIYYGCTLCVLFYLLNQSVTKESFIIKEIGKLLEPRTSVKIKSSIIKCQISSISKILTELESNKKESTLKILRDLPVTISLASYALCVIITILAATILPAHFRDGQPGLSSATTDSLFLSIVFVFRVFVPLVLGFVIYNQSKSITDKQNKIEEIATKIIKFPHKED